MLHQSIQKISTKQLGEKMSPALNGEKRGNCATAPWNFAQYSGFSSHLTHVWEVVQVHSMAKEREQGVVLMLG